VSAPVVVENTPPVVTAALTPESPATDWTMVMSSKITDPDQEDHIYSYRWFLNGQEIADAVNSQTVNLDGIARPGDVLRAELTVHEDGEPPATAVVVADEVTYGPYPTPTTYVAFDSLHVDPVTGRWRGQPASPLARFQHAGPLADYAMTALGAGMRLPTPGANRSSIFTLLPALDTDLHFTFTTDRLPVGGNLFVYGVVRRTDARNEYRASVRIAPSGAVYVRGTALVDGVETAIGPEAQVPGVVIRTGTAAHVRVQASGSDPTTLRIRLWSSGLVEPYGVWQWTGTSSAAGLQTPGLTGMRAYLGSAVTNAPVTTAFQQMHVTDANTP
jgi:hypothetical protein